MSFVLHRPTSQPCTQKYDQYYLIGTASVIAQISESGNSELGFLTMYAWICPQINNNTDAGLHVVIELVYIHNDPVCMCVCVPIQESSSLVDSHVGRTY